MPCPQRENQIFIVVVVYKVLNVTDNYTTIIIDIEYVSI